MRQAGHTLSNLCHRSEKMKELLEVHITGSSDRTQITVTCRTASVTHGNRARVFHTINQSLCIGRVSSQKYILMFQIHHHNYFGFFPCKNCLPTLTIFSAFWLLSTRGNQLAISHLHIRGSLHPRFPLISFTLSHHNENQICNTTDINMFSYPLHVKKFVI